MDLLEFKGGIGLPQILVLDKDISFPVDMLAWLEEQKRDWVIRTRSEWEPLMGRVCLCKKPLYTKEDSLMERKVDRLEESFFDLDSRSHTARLSRKSHEG